MLLGGVGFGVPTMLPIQQKGDGQEGKPGKCAGELREVARRLRVIEQQPQVTRGPIIPHESPYPLVSTSNNVATAPDLLIVGVVPPRPVRGVNQECIRHRHRWQRPTPAPEPHCEEPPPIAARSRWCRCRAYPVAAESCWMRAKLGIINRSDCCQTSGRTVQGRKRLRSRSNALGPGHARYIWYNSLASTGIEWSVVSNSKEDSASAWAARALPRFHPARRSPRSVSL